MPIATSSPTSVSPVPTLTNSMGIDKQPLSPLATSSSSKHVFQLLEGYQKARLQFAQGIADCAARESNMEYLSTPETRSLIIPLLRPLLLDNVVSVQQAAAVALGRLANHSPEMALELVSGDVLPHIVYTLDSSNRFYKKSAAFVLRAVARHSPELAKKVVDANSIDALCACLKDFDPGVKESAAWALGYIARHNEELAQAIVDAGVVPVLVMSLHEPEVTLRRIAASALSDLAKHSVELAQSVVECNSMRPLVSLLSSHDAKLRRQACCTLWQIAKHSINLAEAVVDGDIFPIILTCFKDMDSGVRKQATVLISEISKHSQELAQLVVNSGALAAVIDYLSEARGQARIPAIMTLGYISAFSETLALAVIVSKGILPLLDALTNEPDFQVKGACAWAFGQMGRHSSDHAKTVAANAVLPKLLALLVHPACTEEEVKQKAKRALKSILNKTLAMEALDPLLRLSTPPSVLKAILAQYAKILPNLVDARKQFVTSGGLQRMQEIEDAYRREDPTFAASPMAEHLRTIHQCFPEEIIRYYSPGYSSLLLQKLEEYNKTASPESGAGEAANPGKVGNVGSPGSQDSESSMGATVLMAMKNQEKVQGKESNETPN